MKIPYIQITFLLVAIGLAFTPWYIWSLVIIFHLAVYRSDKSIRETDIFDNLMKKL